MASAEIDVGITGLDAAIKQLNAFAKTGSQAADTIATAFKAVGPIAVAAFGAFSLKHVIDEASAAEKAMTQFTTALKVAGDFSEENVSRFEALSKELQSTANISDELVLNLAGQAKSLGLTSDQTESLIRASTDLASITGQDVNSAFSQLEKTFSGNAGRLAQLFPELKQLTTEQLAAGGAAKFLEERFGGAAANIRNTFSGAVSQLRLQSSDLFEALGNIIVQNPVIVRGINALADTIKNLAELINNNTGSIIAFINNGIIALATQVDKSIQIFAPYLAILYDIGSTLGTVLMPFINETIRGFKFLIGEGSELTAIFYRFLSEALQPVAQGFKIVSVGALQVAKTITQAFGGGEQFIGELDKAMDSLIESTFNQGTALKSTEAAIKSSSNETKNYISTLFETQKAESTLANNKIKAEDQKQKAIAETTRLQRIQIDQARSQIVSAAAANPFDFQGRQRAVEGVRSKEGATKADVEIAKQQGDAAAALGGVALAFKGQQGATELITKGLGTIADTILPGIGGVVAQIASVLAQGPEAVRQFIQGFLDGIPIIIQNIVDSIPVVIDTLVERVPDLITKLVELAPEIAIGFSLSLQAQAPFIATRFTIELIKNIPNFVKAFVDGAFQGAKEAFSKLPIPGLGGGGGGGNITSTLSGGLFNLGFADGGTVPGGAPFVDRVPSLLTPGENVIDRGLNQKLDSFLQKQENTGGKAQQIVVNLMVDGTQLAKVITDLNQRGYRLA